MRSLWPVWHVVRSWRRAPDDLRKMWERALCWNLTFWRARVGGGGGRVRRIRLMWSSPLGRDGWECNDRLHLSCQASTSLTYIVLLTRGCSPWRPAVVMGMTWGESLHSSPGFSRAGQCSTGRCSRRSALRGLWCLSPIQSVSGKPAPYKEKTTLPGAPASVSGLHSLTALTA